MSASAVPDDELVALLARTASAVAGALARADEWHLLDDGAHGGQHASDVVADDAAVATLLAGGVGVLSEESGLHRPDRHIVVAVDPLDGSTNAARGIPWFNVSLAALDDTGPRVAVVRNLVDGSEYRAVRGRGATRDGMPISASEASDLTAAVIGINGHGPHLGWAQFRALGATALDLCLVASGVLDGYAAMWPDSVPIWDYAAGWLICEEAGAVVVDAAGRDLGARDPDDRRTIVAAATPELVAAVVAAFRGSASGLGDPSSDGSPDA